MSRLHLPPAVPVVGAMTLVQAFATMAVLTLAAVAPAVGRDLELSPSLIGYQIALVYLGALMTTSLGGPLARRLGSVRCSQAALAVAAAGCLIAAAPGLAFVALGSLAMGWCYGLTNPAASHLMARVATPAWRNLIFSIKQTGVPLGGVLAGTVAAPVTLWLGWHWLLVLVAAMCLLLALAIQPLRRTWDADRVPSIRLVVSPLATIRFVWRRPALRWLACGTSFYAAIQLCMMTYTVTLLVEEGGRSLVAAGLVLSVLQVAGVIARPFWGWAADRIGDGFVVVIFLGGLMLAATVGVAFVSPAWSTAAIYGLFALFGFSAAGWNGVTMAETARLAPADVAQATGGINFYAFCGVLCGPAGFALAYRAVGSYTGTFALLAGVVAAGIACMVAGRLADRRG